MIKNNIKNSRKRAPWKVSKVKLFLILFSRSATSYVQPEIKKKTLVPRDKNDQIFTAALYIHSYIYGFHMFSKFVQSQCLRSDTFTQ